MKHVKNVLLSILMFLFCAVICSSCGSATNNIIESTKVQLEEKEWECIGEIDGDLDYIEWSSLWGNAIIDPKEEKDMNLYTMVGRHIDESDNKLYVIVKIAFTEENPEGEIYDVMYISESGRIMKADFLNGLEILSPNNKELQEYMYSY